jgi:putative transposase
VPYLGAVAADSVLFMPRSARNHLAGGIFHVTSRGNRGAPIYVDDVCRRRFLSFFDAVIVAAGWKCLAYCLMTNHFHLALAMEQPTLSGGMHWLNGCYAQWFNRRHGFKGHLFEDRFHSEPVESESHLLEVSRYIPLNPVRAGICSHPGAWRWSSYRAMTARGPSGRVSTDLVLPLFSRQEDRARLAYADFVEDGRRHVLAERVQGTVPGTWLD